MDFKKKEKEFECKANMQLKIKTKKQVLLACDICSEEREEFKMVKLFLCDHLFCEGCTSTFVEGKIKEHELFNCPTCSLPYDVESVFFLSLNGE